ncbi:hypothetical protein D3C73_977370 [compost metagenome]
MLSLGRLVTSTVPAPAWAMPLTMKLMSAAALCATGAMAAVGLADAPATGNPWKMLFAPPSTLTRSFDPKVPPRCRYCPSCARIPGGEAWLSVRAPPKA